MLTVTEECCPLDLLRIFVAPVVDHLRAFVSYTKLPTYWHISLSMWETVLAYLGAGMVAKQQESQTAQEHVAYRRVA